MFLLIGDGGGEGNQYFHAVLNSTFYSQTNRNVMPFDYKPTCQPKHTRTGGGDTPVNNKC